MLPVSCSPFYALKTFVFAIVLSQKKYLNKSLFMYSVHIIQKEKIAPKIAYYIFIIYLMIQSETDVFENDDVGSGLRSL